MKKLLLFFCLPLSLWAQKSPVDYVNPLIGTAEHGHTYPGPSVPFGMVQVSPENGKKGWDWCSGYHNSMDKIVGFANLHLSGTGCADLGDILLMPGIGVKVGKAGKYAATFNHENEKAEAGYYSVKLDGSNIKAELTATNRVGVQRYTFPSSKAADVIVNLGYGNDDHPLQTMVQVDGNNRISGYRFSKGWADNQKIFFVAEFSKPFTSSSIRNEDAPGKAKGRNSLAVLRFETNEGEQITVKVGISCVSIEGAQNNLQVEASSKGFDQIRAEARQIWEKELNVVTVQSLSEADQTTFYTALYHSFLAPTTYCDVDGQYRGPDDKVHKGNFTNYCTFSLWDTFRAEHPLLTIVQPKRVPDLVNSLLGFQEQGGLLPVWTLQGCETNCMIGYHSVPVISDAYLKGFTGFDTQKAYEAMKKSALSGKRGLKFLESGNASDYIPCDREGESVSKALEYAYDDWCIAQMAEKMGKKEDATLFNTRAGMYRNYWDNSTGFMRGKTSLGTWVWPFNPMHATNLQHEYTEGNAWQYSWFVPHDVDGLVKLMGGKERFVNKLDSLFTLKLELGPGAPPDVSGLIGLYAHGNEPSHHISYLYAAVGQPSKTQAMVRRIMRTLYNDSKAGLCGNEDCGQMSAWYVFSALGFYPLNPSDGKYFLGSPIVRKASLAVGNGKTFTVSTQNQSETAVYVKEVILNGQKLTQPYITHAQVMEGGNLDFIMSEKP
jgi:predicted alpha-1,2-mannosidase